LFAYDNEGRLQSTQYPNYYQDVVQTWLNPVPGLQFTYTFDTLGRPIKLTGSDGLDWVKDVQYDASGRITAMTRMRQKARTGQGTLTAAYLNESRTYNVRGQLTRKVVTDASTNTVISDLENRFPATTNNGRVNQRKDWISGEEVTYQYDTLNRLISAVTTGPE
jgi:hypothetical protein